MSRRLLTGTLAALVVLLAAGGAAADPGTTTRDGKTLTVSKAGGLRVEGERVRVRGGGYDRSKGIYVAFCVDNGPGKVPTPCGGGADTEGTSGNSVWISDFPPAYGAGLARPYGDGGSFDVEINVRAVLRQDDPETEENETVDCRTARCALVTRNDHTRSDDRTQDVAVLLSFTTAAPAGAPTEPAADEPNPAGAADRSSGNAQAGTTTAAGSRATAPAGGVATPTPAASSAGPSFPASPNAMTPTAAAGEPDDEVLAGGSVARPSADDSSLLLPVLVAGALVAAGSGGAVAWRRRMLRGAPAHA